MQPAPIRILPKVAATRITVDGVVKMTASVSTNADIPNGTQVSVSGYTSVYDSSFSNSHSVSATAKVAGGVINVTLEIPYLFLVAATTDTLSVSLDLRVSVNGAQNLSYSTSFTGTVPLPADGATTTIPFSGSL
jgi:hypothetical protein